ncbi:MAG: hypothetical protein AB7L09_00695 [Nitrospira sp.]
MFRSRRFRLTESENYAEKADEKVNPLALLARERAKADEKEGHDAADYWRGWAAGSFLTGNDNGLGRTPLKTIKKNLTKG